MAYAIFESTHWLFGMAYAWIMHRDASRSADVFDNDFWGDFPISDKLNESDEFAHAVESLKDALMLGKVSAIGVVKGAPREIAFLEWIYMEYHVDTNLSGRCHRVHNSNGEVYSSLRLLRDEVLRCWPPLGDAGKIAKPAHRPPSRRDAARAVIEFLYPHRGHLSETNDVLFDEVNKELVARGKHRVSVSTLRRAIREIEESQK